MTHPSKYTLKLASEATANDPLKTKYVPLPSSVQELLLDRCCVATFQRLGTAVLDRPSHIPWDTGADAAHHPHPNSACHWSRHVHPGVLAIRSRGWAED
jgi:hypothetical protein